MPCVSDYLEASGVEKELERVLCFLEEIKTGKSQKYEDGYSKKVYCKTNKAKLDKATDKLCKKLQKIKDLSVYSLELQLWWRDHKKFDTAEGR